MHRILLIFAIACGNVNQMAPDGGNTGDGDGDGDGDGGGVDAGGVTLDLRILHTVRGELSTDLFVADVVDGQLGAAAVLSGPGGSSPVISSPLASEDGSTVVFRAGDGGESLELFVIDLGTGETASPVRISTDGETTLVLDQFVTRDGRAAIYTRGTVSGGFAVLNQHYFVDLSGDRPGEPVPLGPAGGFVGPGELSADGGTFAFRKDGEAFVVDTSGPVPSAAVRISPTPPSGGGVRELHISADATRAAIVGDLETNDVFELFVVDLTGPTPGPAQKASGPLVSNGDVAASSTFFASTSISSDGGLVAYIADANTDGVEELFLVDTSGATPGPAVRVNDPPVAGGEVSTFPGFQLGPNGRQVAFLADTRVDGVTELFVGDLSGNAQRVSGALVDGGNVEAFAFAPDGAGIAYRADQNTDTISELFYVDLSGAVPSAPQRVNGPLGDGGEVEGSIVFSPDSSQLAFIADAVVDGRLELFLAEIVDGTPQPPVSLQEPGVSESKIARPTFSASGEWLAYAGSTQGPNRELWLVDLRGEAPGPAVSVNSQVETATGVTSTVLRPGL